jgi:hypothetical protein
VRVKVDLQKSIRGYYVKQWKIGSRPFRAGGVTDRFLKAKLLRGGEHAALLQLSIWKNAEELATSIRLGEVDVVPVGKPRYYSGGDVRDAFLVRIEFQYPLPMGARGYRRCQGGWDDATLTETGCKRTATGRFRVVSPQTLKRRTVYLCPSCGARES